MDDKGQVADGGDHQPPTHSFAHANFNLHVAAFSGWGKGGAMGGYVADITALPLIESHIAEARQDLYDDPGLNFHPGEVIRVRECAAGRGRPLSGGIRLSAATRARYRRVPERVVRGLAAMPKATFSTRHTGPGETRSGLAGSIIEELNNRHGEEGTSGLLLIRGDSAATARLVPLGHPSPDAQRFARELSGDHFRIKLLLEPAAFLAYCRNQRELGNPHRAFLGQVLDTHLPAALDDTPS